MISYEMFVRLRTLLYQDGYHLRQAARALGMDIKTARLWSKRTQYQRCAQPKRTSKLDPFKGEIVGSCTSIRSAPSRSFSGCVRAAMAGATRS
jgi:hypothetical protein